MPEMILKTSKKAMPHRKALKLEISEPSREKYLQALAALRRQMPTSGQAQYIKVLSNIKAITTMYIPLVEYIARRYWEFGEKEAMSGQACFIVGISGCQGSGKTSMSFILKYLLQELHGLQAEASSIDDFYLGKEERAELAKKVHPLFKTRGVPGTHDIHILQKAFQSLKARDNAGGNLLLPIFDKGLDDRSPKMRTVKLPCDIFLFEGWCLGAEARPESDLEKPLNTLEKNYDSRKIWRRYVNKKLHLEYQPIFREIDLLIAFGIDDFSWVYSWRSQQEEALAPNLRMSPSSLRHFIMHYERITRDLMQSLEQNADALVSLNKKRELKSIGIKAD